MTSAKVRTSDIVERFVTGEAPDPVAGTWQYYLDTETGGIVVVLCRDNEPVDEPWNVQAASRVAAAASGRYLAVRTPDEQEWHDCLTEFLASIGEPGRRFDTITQWKATVGRDEWQQWEDFRRAWIVRWFVEHLHSEHEVDAEIVP